jgi:hypothetical protein
LRWESERERERESKRIDEKGDLISESDNILLVGQSKSGHLLPD